MKRESLLSSRDGACWLLWQGSGSIVLDSTRDVSQTDGLSGKNPGAASPSGPAAGADFRLRVKREIPPQSGDRACWLQWVRLGFSSA